MSLTEKNAVQHLNSIAVRYCPSRSLHVQPCAPTLLRPDGRDEMWGAKTRLQKVRLWRALEAAARQVSGVA